MRSGRTGRVTADRAGQSGTERGRAGQSGQSRTKQGRSEPGGSLKPLVHTPCRPVPGRTVGRLGAWRHYRFDYLISPPDLRPRLRRGWCAARRSSANCRTRMGFGCGAGDVQPRCLHQRFCARLLFVWPGAQLPGLSIDQRHHPQNLRWPLPISNGVAVICGPAKTTMVTSSPTAWRKAMEPRLDPPW